MESVRRALYSDCLNGQFDRVLSRLRTLPVQEIDYGFLRIYLSRSCQYAHMDSVSYVWYKYVLRHRMLQVQPRLLCQIGQLALYNDKHFIPPQLCEYYSKYYRGSNEEYEYELWRIKVENFARGTGTKTSFREKWKVYLQDADQRFTDAPERFRVRDFTQLAQSFGNTSMDELRGMLFNHNAIVVKNKNSLRLLLNIALSAGEYEYDDKLTLAQDFHNQYEMQSSGNTAAFQDTVAILDRIARKNGGSYRLDQLDQLLKGR